jgi:hypothetical protein
MRVAAGFATVPKLMDASSAMAHSLRRAGHEPEGAADADDAKITMSSSQIGYWQSLESDGVETKFRIDYKDDKKPKQIARDMMRMLSQYQDRVKLLVSLLDCRCLHALSLESPQQACLESLNVSRVFGIAGDDTG